MGRDVFYLTTPIYYPNDVPHIGHAYDAVAADVIARHHRLRGEEVFHLTGTDEHGLKLQRAAEEAGMDPQRWVDEMEPRWREVWSRLDISYDDYIRTTEPRHTAVVVNLLDQVYRNGRDDIYLDTYEGLYCVSCELYYVEADLLEGGLCPIHERPVEVMKEQNYFFRLSAYRDRLLEHYEQRPSAVEPEVRRNEVLSLIRSGLQDFSISRTNFDWGIPLPWDPDHVTYVWFDALTNYLTGAGYGPDDGHPVGCHRPPPRPRGNDGNVPQMGRDAYGTLGETAHSLWRLGLFEQGTAQRRPDQAVARRPPAEEERDDPGLLLPAGDLAQRWGRRQPSHLLLHRPESLLDGVARRGIDRAGLE